TVGGLLPYRFGRGQPDDLCLRLGNGLVGYRNSAREGKRDLAVELDHSALAQLREPAHRDFEHIAGIEAIARALPEGGARWHKRRWRLCRYAVECDGRDRRSKSEPPERDGDEAGRNVAHRDLAPIGRIRRSRGAPCRGSAPAGGDPGWAEA